MCFTEKSWMKKRKRSTSFHGLNLLCYELVEVILSSNVYIFNGNTLVNHQWLPFVYLFMDSSSTLTTWRKFYISSLDYIPWVKSNYQKGKKHMTISIDIMSNLQFKGFLMQNITSFSYYVCLFPKLVHTYKDAVAFAYRY
jgi:hypothetical protein